MKIQRVAARIALLLACSQFSTLAAEPVDMAKRAEELKSLKWGMFVCWSFSTFSGKEWSPGVKDLALFKATEVDTDQWARTAKEAGMGYIDFLTKHHDGFCLWDTKTTQRKVTKAPLGKDVLRLLQQSCDKYGIKLALYFSENEFEDNKDYHPGGYSVEMKKAQLKELLTEYGADRVHLVRHTSRQGGCGRSEFPAHAGICNRIQGRRQLEAGGDWNNDRRKQDLRVQAREGPLLSAEYHQG